MDAWKAGESSSQEKYAEKWWKKWAEWTIQKRKLAQDNNVSCGKDFNIFIFFFNLLRGLLDTFFCFVFFTVFGKWLSGSKGRI